MSSAPSTPTLSHFSTPNQTPFSTPSNSPEEKHPQIIITEENDVFAQESIRMTDYGDDSALTITSLLKEYTNKMERIKERTLAEQRRDHEKIQAELRRQKDSALSDLGKEQALTTRCREELAAEIIEKERLTQKVETLEKQLDKEHVERANLEDQLAEKDAQLSDVAKMYESKEEIWNSVMGPLARIENENNEIREQLIEMNQQLERTNASIAEERANTDRNLSELTSARKKLAEAQDAERRLIEKDYEVVLLNNKIINLKERKSQLRFELDRARKEAEQVNQLRSANEELEARCKTLTREASNLNDIRHHHKDEIKRLEQHHEDEVQRLDQLHENEIKRLEQHHEDETRRLEQHHEDETKRLEQHQQRTMSGEINRLDMKVRKEQMRIAKLQSTVSNLEQEREGLNIQLEDAHAAARHAEICMRWRVIAYRARCRSLHAEVAELKSSRLPKAKAKFYFAHVKQRDSSAKPRLVERPPVTIHEPHWNRQVQSPA